MRVKRKEHRKQSLCISLHKENFIFQLLFWRKKNISYEDNVKGTLMQI